MYGQPSPEHRATEALGIADRDSADEPVRAGLLRRRRAGVIVNKQGVVAQPASRPYSSADEQRLLNVRTRIRHGKRRSWLARLGVVGDDQMRGVEERRRPIAEGPHTRLGVQPRDYADKLGALASLIGRSVNVHLLAGARVSIQIAGFHDQTTRQGIGAKHDQQPTPAQDEIVDPREEHAFCLQTATCWRDTRLI